MPPTLSELYADPGPPDDPYCQNCYGFGFIKEDAQGMRAELGWFGCSKCGSRQRRAAEVIDYNAAWSRERRNVK